MNCKRKKYGYVVKVEERVLYSTLVESDEKLPWSRLEAIAERRRIKGELSFEGVIDVDSWCDYVRGGQSSNVKRNRRKKVRK